MRSRPQVKLIGSGKVYSGFSLVRTLAHGADLTNAARSFMFSLGCIQALKCNSNTCPTGITTQDKALESGLDVTSKSHRVAAFHKATVHAALEIVGAMGVSSPRDISPHHLYRRESGMIVKDFTALETESGFPTLSTPGVLLQPESAEVPAQLRAWWLEGGELHKSMRAQTAFQVPPAKLPTLDTAFALPKDDDAEMLVGAGQREQAFAAPRHWGIGRGSGPPTHP